VRNLDLTTCPPASLLSSQGSEAEIQRLFHTDNRDLKIVEKFAG
jgi:hypothetical protein